MGDKPTRLYTSRFTSSEAGFINGSVKISRTGQTRRSFSLDMAVEGYSVFNDLFDPMLGYDYKLYRGIEYAPGDEEVVPLGVFKADTATLKTSGTTGTSVSMTGYDYSYLFSQSKFRTSFYVATGAAYAATIQALYTAKAPLCQWATTDLNIGYTAYTLPVMNFTDKDNPWETMGKLAQSMQSEAYYDQDGLLTVRLIQDPATITPALDLTAGVTAVRVGSLVRKTSVSKTYNGVIVRGSAPWLLLPISGEAWDTDEFSPTYRYGAFGERPEYIEDAYVTSSGQADAVALAELYKVKGASEEISFNIIPDPRLDVLDTAIVRDNSIGVYDMLAIDSLTIPLMGGQMSGVVKLTYRRNT